MIEEERVAGFEVGDFVEFRETGESVKGAYRCTGCGYGVAVTSALPPCPMCGGAVWEESASSPFGRAVDGL